MKKAATWRNGAPLDENTQAQLKKLIKELGEKEASKVIGLSQVSIVRAAAGCGLRRVTAIAIEAQLSSLKKAS